VEVRVLSSTPAFAHPQLATFLGWTAAWQASPALASPKLAERRRGVCLAEAARGRRQAGLSSWGFTLGIFLNRDFELEFIVDRQRTTLEASGTEPVKVASL
jgi:hypothetical protein